MILNVKGCVTVHDTPSEEEMLKEDLMYLLNTT